MSIVPQFASFSHSPCLLLPAPKIAGLLPANVPRVPDHIVLRLDDEKPIRNFPTPEELDLDIYSTFLRIALRAVRVSA